MLKMSNTGSNNGVAGGAPAAKGSIPSSVWKTIQQIKEITGNHIEEEIYAMLKECSMDPNETIQKLIFQDTFHEVKRKRDQRKENMNNKSGGPNWKAGTQGRGNKGGSGNHSSHDAGGRRKSIAGKVNGTSRVLEKSISPTIVPCSLADNNNTSSSIASPNEPSGVASGPTTGTVAGKLEGQPEHLIDAKKSPQVRQVASDMHGQRMKNAQLAGAGAIQREVGNQHAPVEHFPSSSNDSKATSATSEVESSDVQGKMPSKSQGPGKNLVPESLQPVSTVADSSVGRLSSNNSTRLLVTGPQKAGTVKEWKPKGTNANSVEPNTEVHPMPVAQGTKEATMEPQKKLEQLQISEVQHVIFPNHLHLPEAEKLGFCFGSFGEIYGLNTTSNSGTKYEKSPPISETSDAIEGTAKEQLPSVGSALAVDKADYPDPPPSSSSEQQDSLSSKGDNFSSSIIEPNQSKQENVHGDNQYSVVETSPNNNFMPPILGSRLGTFENSESQACDMPRLPNFVGGNLLAVPTLPVYRQPTGVHLPHYPANYFPYGHYFSPFYVQPPAIHQFLSNGAFPQQPMAGSVYPPSPPAAAAKYSLSQYRQGSNAANSTHVGFPGGYGLYGSSTANYNPTLAVTAGNPTSHEDLSVSQFKESKVYDGLQQASSFYSLPQSQVAITTPIHPGHETIAGIYHPVPPVTNPALHPLLQQSQAVAGPADMVGSTAVVYQQPKYSQLNWPSGY